MAPRRKPWRSRVGLALAGLALAVPVWGDPPSPAVQVLAVEIPVQVVRDGEPVRGLEAADFEIYEGRRRLPVTGFEALDLASPAARGRSRTAAVPAAARRHFLFLFDLAFSEPQAIARARRSAAGVLAQLQPTDLAAVATYSATRGPQLVLGFTADRRQLDAAIASLGLPDLIARPLDPLRLVLEEVLGAGNAAAGSAPATRDPLAEVTDVAISARLEFITNAVEQSDRTAQRNHVNAFTRSLADLARQMGVIEGRKYLVFLSEGFESSLLQGTPDPQRQEEMRENALHGESWRVNPEERYGLTETGNDVERMLEEFRRADCILEAVDIGGLRAGADQGAPRPAGRDSLLMMAKGTGGELFESFNDLGVAMSQMLQRTSVTYVLAIEPDRLQPEGEYHRLRVELKKPLRGVRLVHRPGYYLPKPYAEQSSVEKLLEAANQVMSGEESDTVATAVLATPFRGDGEKAYVPVMIEIDGATLSPDTRPATQSAARRDLPLRPRRGRRRARLPHPDRGPGPHQGRAGPTGSRVWPQVLRPPGPAARRLLAAHPGAQRRHRPLGPARGARARPHLHPRAVSAAPARPRSAQPLAGDARRATGRG